MMIQWVGLALIAGLGAGTAAQAQQLNFNVAYGDFDPGVVESFTLNPSVPGTPSATSALYYGGPSVDEDYTISNDSLGHNTLVVGSPDDFNFFATGFSDDDAFGHEYTNTYGTSLGLYDGVSPYINAVAGETITGADGAIITVSAAPEPTSWALMIAGLAGVGVALRQSRFRRERRLAAVPA